MKYRRINIHGAPSSGKSSLCAHLFTSFKEKHYNCELCYEAAKVLAYRKRAISFGDQLKLFSEQYFQEEAFLGNGADLIITDAPLTLSALYAKYFYGDKSINLFNLAQDFEEQYNSINIFLTNESFSPVGRYQSQKDAQDLEKFFFEELEQMYGLKVYSVSDKDKIFKDLLEKL